MSCIKFSGLIVLVIIYSPLYESCLINNVKQCTDYLLLSGVQFHGFMSADILDFYCRRLQAALECVNTKGRLRRCQLLERLPFDTQQGVVDIVCKHRREEYLKSSQCFSNDEVKKHITTTCLPVLTSEKVVSRDRCRTLNWVLECARTKVLMTDGCDSADSDLMVDLVQTYMQPKSIMPNSKQPNSKRPNSIQPFCPNLGSKTESQGTGDRTTKKYLHDATLPSQSTSWTNNDDIHPEITLKQTQDLTQQSNELMNTPSSSAGLLPETEMEPPEMKSTREYSTKSEITTMEHTTIAISSSTSTVPGSQGVDDTATGSTKSTTVELESENMKQQQKNANRSMSDSQAKTLKSTQGSGNDATVLHFTQSQLAMVLSSIIFLVFNGKKNIDS